MIWPVETALLFFGRKKKFVLESKLLMVLALIYFPVLFEQALLRGKKHQLRLAAKPYQIPAANQEDPAVFLLH